MATISPHADWDGTLGSGYSDGGGGGVAQPADPTRTSFKPILALDTVPGQRISGTLEITAVAFCKDGIDSVDFYLEGTKVSVTTPELNSTTGTYGYTVTIDVSGESSDGPMRLFVEAVPTSGSAQNRVLGAYTFYCNQGGTLANTGSVYYVDSSSSITVNGSITGTFEFGEAMSQATSGATAYYIEDDGSSVKVAIVGGTPNDTNDWTGGTSGASFTPSDTPTANGTSSGPGATDTPFDSCVNATTWWRTNVGGGSSTANISGVTLKVRNGSFRPATTTLNADNGHLIYEPDTGHTRHILYRSGGTHRVIVEQALIRNFTWNAVYGSDDMVLGNIGTSPLDLWIDNCVWNVGSKVMPDTTSIQSVRFTNCTTNDHGFLFNETVQLIRGCTANDPDEDDVFSRAKWVLDCTVNGIADPPGGNHGDIWQLEGITADVENFLMYNVAVYGSDSVQPLQWAEVMTDCAVVNFLMQRTGTSATVFANIQGSWDHVLLWNLSWNDYELRFREDLGFDYTASANSEVRQCALKGTDLVGTVTEANILTAVDFDDCNFTDASFSGGTNMTSIAEATVFDDPTTEGYEGMLPTASMPTATKTWDVDVRGSERSDTTRIGALEKPPLESGGPAGARGISSQISISI